MNLCSNNSNLHLCSFSSHYLTVFHERENCLQFIKHVQLHHINRVIRESGILNKDKRKKKHFGSIKTLKTHCWRFNGLSDQQITPNEYIVIIIFVFNKRWPQAWDSAPMNTFFTSMIYLYHTNNHHVWLRTIKCMTYAAVRVCIELSFNPSVIIKRFCIAFEFILNHVKNDR